MYKFAFKNLWTRKSRTALAMIGLVIALIGIISLLSISAGIRSEVSGVFSKMQGIVVMQGDAMAPPFSKVSLDYANKLESIQGVKTAVPLVVGMAGNFEGKSSSISSAFSGSSVEYIGLDPSKYILLPQGSLYNPTIVSGRGLKSYDVHSAIIGKLVADDYKKTVGSKVKFNDREFRVVGIFDTGSDTTNNLIGIPLSVAQDIGKLDSNTVNEFYLDLQDPNAADKVEKLINFKFNNTTDNLKAMSGSSVAFQAGGLLGSLDAFFIGVASIAFFVGLVGVINTMLMSVRERTREFGILKAVGWTSGDILKLIIYESFFLGIIGGIIGVIISVIIVNIAQMFISFPLLVTPDLVIYSLLAAVISGVIGGVYPAWKAAGLDPIQAIRYE